MTRQTLFGFHAIGIRLKTAPRSVVEVHVDRGRRDQRMRQLLARIDEAAVRIVDSDDRRLRGLAGNDRHQGVVAIVESLVRSHSLDDTLDAVEASGAIPLVLVLDGVTDPHNLGACLRVADGAGAHAVIAPKDHAVGINATVAKVASGAARPVRCFLVTRIARTRRARQAPALRVVGAAEGAPRSLYALDLRGPLALVFGAEGSGMRQLTARTCDELVQVPMRGAVESLNVSVASAICLYEAARQRLAAAAPTPSATLATEG
jgi:23S rRNA (guanosine2251-2'-O)-methyltransferase